MYRPPQKGIDPPRIEAYTIQPIDHALRVANQDKESYQNTRHVAAFPL